MAKILPSDPGRNYLAHKDEIDAAVRRVMESGRYILGDEVTAFEQEFAGFVGVPHGIGVGSGTEALHLALRACGVGAGDFVVTVSHTAVATVAAIELAGATPLLVDIERDTFTMSPSSLKAALESSHGRRIRAIVPVHLYGQPAGMSEIASVVSNHAVFLIEDCAQSHGATLDGQTTGSIGHIAAFSFYPTKNLGALGDGGAVVTKDSGLAEQARLLRQYGWRTRYISDERGMNSRLDEMQAAILRIKLPHLEAENKRRQEIAVRYDEAFKSTTLRLPVIRPGATHVYHQYTIRSDRRDALRDALEESGIGSSILYPQPIHLQPAYKDRLQTAGPLENTERAAHEILSLPMHPHLTEEEVDSVIKAVLQSAR